MMKNTLVWDGFRRRVTKLIFRSVMISCFRFFSFFRRKRDILFWCNGPLMAAYLADVVTLLKEDPKVNLWLAIAISKHTKERSDAIESITEMMPIKTISLRWAQVKCWDLIVIADHSGQDFIANQKCASILIPHGIESGKKSDIGNNYLCANSIDRNGKPRYSKIFVSSNQIRENTIAVANNPQFSETIKVVGDIKFDKLLEKQKQRSMIRKKIGFTPEKTVVYVMSTWGANCLWQSMGKNLINELDQLKNQFSFILGVHNNEYQEKGDDQQNWGEYLRRQEMNGFTVVYPPENWSDYMIACDMIISDHTSLSIYGALLLRPIIYMDFEEDLVANGSLISKLRSISPILKKDASNLYDTLLRAHLDYPTEQLIALGKEIVSYPGMSSERFKKEIYELLKVD